MAGLACTSDPVDVAYLKTHGFAEIIDAMLGTVLLEKPADSLGFCIDYLSELRRKHAFTLRPHPTIPKPSHPVVLIVMDGWGESTTKDEYNAVHVAKTPTYDAMMSVEGRARTVVAHGKAVGLPSNDDMGNSEVGHNALGSGQVTNQGAKLVDTALESEALYTSKGFEHVQAAFENHTLHLIGLLTKGGVHARFDQLVRLIQGAVKRGAKRIRLHLLTDGRDVVDGTSVEYAEELEGELRKIREGTGGASCDVQVASGGGRMYVTMDRYEAHWDIVERGWKAHVLGEAPHAFPSFGEAVKTLRAAEGDAGSDQFLPPFVVADDEGKPVGPVEDGDGVVLFNFRADRMVQMSKAFEYPDAEFPFFDRVRRPDVRFAGMLQYDGDLKLPTHYLVDAPSITSTSGEYLVKNGVRTFVAAETQKFGHVTFFWNGNKSGYINSEMETYYEEPSDKIVFDQKPEMKAKEVTAAALEAIKSGKFDMVRINYANPDMVGHTGNLKATVQAVEVVDRCVGEVIAATEAAGGRWLVTSDHGNADDMVQRVKATMAPLIDPDTKEPVPCKSHTLAPVPVCIGGSLPDSVRFKPDTEFASPAGLANVTATMVNLLGFAAPPHFEPSLI
eukprot:TRINITY_DN1603_c0_g1_i1.p1 TRINITY_DN1603_c0_g1~~TRINITY_DN1603_c0_g1_i1.p1  ORF type:complete len:633 (+),score=276.65 TRINITY_DN1603_c0_g1_i1:52-1899(+)